MLTKDSKDLIWLNVAKGFISKTVKKDDGTKIKEEYNSVAGLITSVDFRLRPSYDDPKIDEKEMLISITDGNVNYMLVAKLYRPFTDGLLASLANPTIDFDRKIEIKAYPSTKGAAQAKPSTLCLVRYADTKERINWITGIPAPVEHEVDGTIIKTRREKNAFLDQCLLDVKASVAEANAKRSEDLESYTIDNPDPDEETLSGEDAQL